MELKCRKMKIFMRGLSWILNVLLWQPIFQPVKALFGYAKMKIIPPLSSVFLSERLILTSKLEEGMGSIYGYIIWNLLWQQIGDQSCTYRNSKYVERILNLKQYFPRKVCLSVHLFVSQSIRPVTPRPPKKSLKQKISLNKVVRCISRVTKIHSESHWCHCCAWQGKANRHPATCIPSHFQVSSWS